jgi:hypothetical protein
MRVEQIPLQCPVHIHNSSGALKHTFFEAPLIDRIMYRQALLQEESSHTPSRHTRHKATSINMITPHHRIIVIIIRQISRRNTHLQPTPVNLHLHLSLKVRLIYHRNSNCTIRVLERSD